MSDQGVIILIFFFIAFMVSMIFFLIHNMPIDKNSVENHNTYEPPYQVGDITTKHWLDD
ncbi:hypothetical protein D3C78_20670 [compost metagenome]